MTSSVSHQPIIFTFSSYLRTKRNKKFVMLEEGFNIKLVDIWIKFSRGSQAKEILSEVFTQCFVIQLALAVSLGDFISFLERLI